MRALYGFLMIVVLLAAIWGNVGCVRKSADKAKGDDPSRKHAVGASEETVQTVGHTTAIKNSDINSDETVVFFPTYAYLDEDGKTWTVAVHGHIFKAKGDSVRRRAMLSGVAKMLEVEDGSAADEMLRRRLGLFLVDNERGKDIFVRMGGKTYAAGTSDADGHFSKDLRLLVAEVEGLLGEKTRDVQGRDGSGSYGVLSYRAVTRESDERNFDGNVWAVDGEGLSVISDIDDTIKHSQVTDSAALLANTFLRKFEPVAGMAELYRDWAGKGVVFHYVSGSPWQLYSPLAEFISAEGFPGGSFNLKQFRLKDPSSLGLLGSQESHKLRAIEPIMMAFPGRRFILVGDSGEQDPEIYAEIARKHRGQVVGIFIRNVTGAKADDVRFGAVRKGLGEVRFMLFEDAESLRPAVAEILTQQK